MRASPAREPPTRAGWSCRCGWCRVCAGCSCPGAGCCSWPRGSRRPGSTIARRSPRAARRSARAPDRCSPAPRTRKRCHADRASAPGLGWPGPPVEAGRRCAGRSGPGADRRPRARSARAAPPAGPCCHRTASAHRRAVRRHGTSRCRCRRHRQRSVRAIARWQGRTRPGASTDGRGCPPADSRPSIASAGRTAAPCVHSAPSCRPRSTTGAVRPGCRSTAAAGGRAAGPTRRHAQVLLRRRAPQPATRPIRARRYTPRSPCPPTTDHRWLERAR